MGWEKAGITMADNNTKDRQVDWIQPETLGRADVSVGRKRAGYCGVLGSRFSVPGEAFP